MEELATRVADKVEERLRKAPVVEPQLLNVAQAGIKLGRTEKSIRGMIAQGKLNSSSPDGRVQIDVKDIDLLIANSKKK